jgi:hypothetical protein
MKRLSLAVLVVSLLIMTNSASAATWGYWTAATGDWTTSTNWNPAGPPAITQTGDIKFGDACDLVATVSTDLVTAYGTYPCKFAIARRCGIEIEDGGILANNKEVKVGDSTLGDGPDDGYVTVKTGGTLNMPAPGKLMIGYKALGVGTVTIESGATLTGDRLYVGTGGDNGGAGTFIVEGPGSTIRMSKLYVGTSESTGGKYLGTGTVEFQLGSGVSTINMVDSYIDPVNEAAAVANLVVNNDGAAPTDYVVLVANSGSLTGRFDSVTLTGNLGVYTHLVYNYDTVSKTWGTGNDIALVPEPATVALFGLGGLIAIVRRRSRR